MHEDLFSQLAGTKYVITFGVFILLEFIMLSACGSLGFVCWIVTGTTIEYIWLYKIQILQEKTLHQLPRQNYILLMVQKIWVYLVGDVLLSQLTFLC